MGLSELVPDEIVYAQLGRFPLNATLVYTWVVMALLLGVSWLLTRRLCADARPPRLQVVLEAIVDGMRSQIEQVGVEDAYRYLPFIGTLFLFIAVSNLLSVVPGFVPPTASLSTTGALALAVFVAVPTYGIALRGPRAYFANYVRPTVLMLPFNIMGEVTRTVTLAVRLFGNIMSGGKMAAVLLALVPVLVDRLGVGAALLTLLPLWLFRVLMMALSLLTGLIQAYIFAVLAMVYIASGAEAHEKVATSTANTKSAEPRERRGRAARRSQR